MKIRKNDKVKITVGKDRGKEGKVLQVFPEEGRVAVEGLNLRVKHLRQRREGETGQRLQFPAPLSLANVSLVCPRCSQPTRVGYKILTSTEGRKKIRVCKKCREAID